MDEKRERHIVTKRFRYAWRARRVLIEAGWSWETVKEMSVHDLVVALNNLHASRKKPKVKAKKKKHR